jgi:hypothetical protein
MDNVKRILPTAVMAGFDTNGDSHYQYISALQKSIRGSDPDAAVFWLSKLLEGGDIISPIRRLPAICCEDIGLAYPDAIVHTMACCQAAESLGLPEAYKPLTEAVILLTLAFVAAMPIVLHFVLTEGFAAPEVCSIDKENFTPNPEYGVNNFYIHFAWVTVITYGALLFITIAGTWIPVYRATRILPADALREE